MGNPGKGCPCPEVHMAGSWWVSGHSAVNKARPTQNRWGGTVHQGPRCAHAMGLKDLCESWPWDLGGFGPLAGESQAQQLGTAANGGRADTVMKKTYGPFKRQLVSEAIALEVEYF